MDDVMDDVIDEVRTRLGDEAMEQAAIVAAKAETIERKRKMHAKLDRIRYLMDEVTRMTVEIEGHRADVFAYMKACEIDRFHGAQIVASRQVRGDPKMVHERWPDICTEIVPEKVKFRTLAKIDKALQTIPEKKRAEIEDALDIKMGREVLRV